MNLIRNIFLLLALAVGCHAASVTPITDPEIYKANGDLSADQYVTAASLDANFAVFRTRFNALLVALKAIQRDDNTVMDKAVKLYALHPEVIAVLNSNHDWQVRTACMCAAATNITLSGLQTIDGWVTSSGDRVFVWGQTAPAENGIWVAAAGAWTRATDADSAAELDLTYAAILHGTTYIGYTLLVTNQSIVTVGTDAISVAPVITNTSTGGGGGGGGGTGTVTSVALSAPASIMTTTGSPITTNGTLVETLVSQTQNRIWAGPAVAPAAAPTFRALVTADLPNTAVVAGSYTSADITVDATGRITAAANGSGGGGGGGSGTVTSVALTMPAEFSVAGSPVTTAGTLAATKATQAAHAAWLGPASGSAAQPAFRQPTYNDVATAYKLTAYVASTSNINIASPGFSWDGGVVPSSGDRILLTGQSTASQNGLWVFDTSSTAMSRPEDYATGNTVEAVPNIIVYVLNGTTNNGTFWRLSTTGAITIDTTATSWTKVQLKVAGGSATGILPASNGGTGVDGSSAANGSLLIGNGSGFTVAALTAGSGVKATSGAGSLALATLTRQSFSNVDTTVTASATAVIVLAQTGTMTAPRVLTLCAASAVTAGTVVQVIDESRSVTSTNTLTITRAGSDNIAGGTSYVMTRADQPVVLISDGSSKWNLATNDGLPTFATGWLKCNGTSNSWSTITTGDVTGLGGMATQNATAVAITGGAIDGTSLGSTTRITGTAKVTALDVSQGTITVNTLPAAAVQATWNSGAVVFTGLLVNVTNSASSASSLLQDWQVGGASFANLTRGGSLTLAGNLAMSAGTLTVGGVNQAVTSTVVSGSNTSFLNGQVTANPGSSSTGVLSGIKGTAITSAANAQNITTTTAGQGGGGLNGVTGLATHAGTGTVSEANGFLAQVSTTNTSGTITADAGVRVLNPSKAGGTTITTNYGVKVEDQTAGTTNYAVYTGTGQVYHGDDVIIGVAGKGLQVKEGTNAKMGTATLVGGVATVSTTAVTASSRIQLTGNADGGTPGWLRVDTRTAGTSFHIQSSSGTDTSTVAWFIVEPAP